MPRREGSDVGAVLKSLAARKRPRRSTARGALGHRTPNESAALTFDCVRLRLTQLARPLGRGGLRWLAGGSPCSLGSRGGQVSHGVARDGSPNGGSEIRPAGRGEAGQEQWRRRDPSTGGHGTDCPSAGAWADLDATSGHRRCHTLVTAGGYLLTGHPTLRVGRGSCHQTERNHRAYDDMAVCWLHEHFSFLGRCLRSNRSCRARGRRGHESTGTSVKPPVRQG